MLFVEQSLELDCAVTGDQQPSFCLWDPYASASVLVGSARSGLGQELWACTHLHISHHHHQSLGLKCQRFLIIFLLISICLKLSSIFQLSSSSSLLSSALYVINRH